MRSMSRVLHAWSRSSLLYNMPPSPLRMYISVNVSNAAQVAVSLLGALPLVRIPRKPPPPLPPGERHADVWLTVYNNWASSCRR